MKDDVSEALEVPGEYRLMPFAERKSQNLTFLNYFKHILLHLLVGGLSGSTIGWAIDTWRVNKTNHLNDGFGSFKWWGGLLGALAGGFINWRRNEAMQLQTAQVLRDYRDLPGLLISNEDLAKDNRVLTHIVEYQRTKLSNVPENRISTDTQKHMGSLDEAPQLHLPH
ncbi:MAG: hypothetical protein SFW64_04230 [Alphaproteobacteria bacterium]|nr:hypothetical protein [Alphaproteobacteria bacterium]